MDPISALGAAAASQQFAVSLLVTSVKVIELCRKLHNASESVQRLSRQVQQLEGIAREIINSAPLQTQSVAGVLQACLATLRELDAILSSCLNRNTEGPSTRLKRNVTALLKEKDFDSLFGRLEREKTSLILCIQVIDA